jgi:C-terminal processing protease CtpA/Prc
MKRTSFLLAIINAFKHNYTKLLWLFKVNCWLLIFLPIILASCTKEDSQPETPLNVAVYNTMKGWYLWYDSIPSVDPLQYKSPSDLLEAIKYKKLDRWSYIITLDEYNQYYVEGKYYGHGFGYGTASDGTERITYIFKSSSLYKAGVRRGWIIKKIDNTRVSNNNISSLLGENKAGITNTFTFGRESLPDTTIASTKSEVSMEMVLLDTVYTVSNRKVGYMVLYSFIADAKNELNTVFSRFYKANIQDLIIDLRYNTGGYTDVGKLLASLIVGKSHSGDILCKFIHNDKKSKYNDSLRIDNLDYSLSLSRIFILTTGMTASTSEIMINGLKPLIDVYTIGQNTQGKPVGMDIQLFEDYKYALFPISFKIVNRENAGDYYQGFKPDQLVADDLTHDFGDIQEKYLWNALYYVQNGSFSNSQKGSLEMNRKISNNWWDREFGAY